MESLDGDSSCSESFCIFLQRERHLICRVCCYQRLSVVYSALYLTHLTSGGNILQNSSWPQRSIFWDSTISSLHYSSMSDWLPQYIFIAYITSSEEHSIIAHCSYNPLGTGFFLLFSSWWHTLSCDAWSDSVNLRKSCLFLCLSSNFINHEWIIINYYAL